MTKPHVPLVSIGVAVYNVEPWLDKCLESVMNQTYENWECFIINDGSTDNSKEIASRYCKLDNRFKLIDKINEGVSTVRNIAIEKSNGEFIYFVDGDDMLPSYCLDYCVSHIGDADILAAECTAITKKGIPIRTTNKGGDFIINSSDALIRLLNRQLLSSVWSKFYRKTAIAHIRFNKNLRSGQDLYFNAQILIARKNLTIIATPKPIYFYRILEHSISHIKNESRKNRLLAEYEEMESLFKSYVSKFNPLEKDAFAKDMLRRIYFFSFSFQSIIKHVDKTSISLISKWMHILDKKDSKEYILAQHIVAHNPLYSSLFLTLKYFPQEIKDFLKGLLK